MKRFNSFLFWAIALVFLSLAMQSAQAMHRGNPSAVVANTYVVYSGCDVPPNANSGTTFYLNNAIGNDSNDGLSNTVGHAWLTGNHAEATMTSGDTTLVETGSGTYSSLTVNRTMSVFTTIKADTGQTPLFTTITINSAAKHWVLHGLKSQATANGLSPLIAVNSTANQVVFYGMDISSASKATAAGWTQANFQNTSGTGLTRYQLVDINGTGSCVALENSTIYVCYIGVGFTQTSSVLLYNNDISWCARDSFDYASDNVEAAFNTLHDQVDDGSGGGDHPDFMQGQPGNAPSENFTFHHIYIHDNKLFDHWTSPSPYPTSCATQSCPEGIVHFDEAWDDENIWNNQVVLEAVTEVQIASCTNCNIENNDVLMYPESTAGGITVNAQTASGVLSANILVRNNIVSNLENDSCPGTYTYDHNLVHKRVAWWCGPSPPTFNTTPQTLPYGTANVISNAAITTWFQVYAPATPALDFTLIGGSLPKGAGIIPAPLCPDKTLRGVNPNPSPPDEGALC